jgi:hypothetical protein
MSGDIDESTILKENQIGLPLLEGLKFIGDLNPQAAQFKVKPDIDKKEL